MSIDENEISQKLSMFGIDDISALGANLSGLE
jgi:hypothetical protein